MNWPADRPSSCVVFTPGDYICSLGTNYSWKLSIFLLVQSSPPSRRDGTQLANSLLVYPNCVCVTTFFFYSSLPIWLVFWERAQKYYWQILLKGFVFCCKSERTGVSRGLNIPTFSMWFFSFSILFSLFLWDFQLKNSLEIWQESTFT